jgi:hypothetical protein
VIIGSYNHYFITSIVVVAVYDNYRCDKVLIEATNYHGYDNYRCDKEVIEATNYHGYDNYRCDKVLIYICRSRDNW